MIRDAGVRALLIVAVVLLAAGCLAGPESPAAHANAQIIEVGAWHAVFDVQGNGDVFVQPGNATVTVGHGWTRLRADHLVPGTDYVALSDDGRVLGRWTTDQSMAVLRGSIGAGAYIYTDQNACTLSFMVAGAYGRIMALTAGHCVYEEATVFARASRMPLDARPDDAVELGKVIHIEAALDIALIDVRPEVYAKLSPAVAHWTGPADSHAARPTTGGLLCAVGWGDHLSILDATRMRCGEWLGYGTGPSSAYMAWTQPAEFGDSGSPVIEYGTGRPAAVVTSGAGFETTGPSMCEIYRRFEGTPLEFRVTTANYDPPPPTPAPPTVARLGWVESTDCRHEPIPKLTLHATSSLAAE